MLPQLPWAYPVWLGRLTHLLRGAQSQWPPFCFHSQLCKNDTRVLYQKTRMPRNWDEYFKCLRKLGHFQQGKLLIVLELLHLKMEVTVSEPCDVIRVPWVVINFSTESDRPFSQQNARIEPVPSGTSENVSRWSSSYSSNCRWLWVGLPSMRFCFLWALVYYKYV